MNNTHSEIWTHLVLRTRNNQPVFKHVEIPIIVKTLEDFAAQHNDPRITFSILSHQIHLLINLPEGFSMNGLAAHLQTFIKTRIKQNPQAVSDFAWEKVCLAYAISINSITTEKSVFNYKPFKHTEKEHKLLSIKK